MFLLNTLVADNSVVDEKHLEKYPFCGKMNFRDIKAIKRVVNSEEAIESYRWVVRIYTTNLWTHKTFHGLCSGSIITER